jgi:hypothetical protein
VRTLKKNENLWMHGQKKTKKKGCGCPAGIGRLCTQINDAALLYHGGWSFFVALEVSFGALELSFITLTGDFVPVRADK